MWQQSYSCLESSLEAFGAAMRDRRWIENVADDAEVAGILDRLAHGLDEGGIGIGILNAYAPGAGVQELTAVCHLRRSTMSRIDPESAAEADIRLIGYAGATGAHMRICHFNSSSKTDVERCAVLIRKAQAQGRAARIRAGRVHLNGAPFDRSLPFGGCKHSGNGREFGCSDSGNIWK